MGKRFFYDIISLCIAIVWHFNSFFKISFNCKYPAGNCILWVGNGGAGVVCGVSSRLVVMYMYVYMSVSVGMHVCIYVCVYVCVCIYIYIYMYVYVCIYVCMCVFVYIYIYMYVCMCVCIYIYVCVCVYMCVYVYMYICICLDISYLFLLSGLGVVGTLFLLLGISDFNFLLTNDIFD